MIDSFMNFIATLMYIIGVDEIWLHKAFAYYFYSECKPEWIIEVPYSSVFPDNPNAFGMPNPELSKQPVKRCSICLAIHGP